MRCDALHHPHIEGSSCNGARKRHPTSSEFVLGKARGKRSARLARFPVDAAANLSQSKNLLTTIKQLTMKLTISLLTAALLAAVAPTAAAMGHTDGRATPGLRRALGGAASFGGGSNSSGTSEICVPSATRYSQVEVKLFHGLAAVIGDDSWTGVTQPGQEDPTYAVGCGFLDFKCYVCDLCEDIYGALVDTGSEAACDLACVAIAEAAGGGPEDRT